MIHDFFGSLVWVFGTPFLLAVLVNFWLFRMKRGFQVLGSSFLVAILLQIILVMDGLEISQDRFGWWPISLPSIWFFAWLILATGILLRRAWKRKGGSQGSNA